ncbi:MAG TPA: 2OG-Fe(II) oxygenase [Coleofasciculaceae cyanobacterium]|jgi:Rps23 Pro-64 3,4-dihydroxylase Tpa1-like proline 4-hydroxylase
MKLSSTYYLDPDYLNNLVDKHGENYKAAKPFPHVVIDNFLPETLLDSILGEFPRAGAIEWQKFEAAAERKLASKSELQMGEMTRFLLYQLNSSTFITFLERLTGVDGLIPDPHFEGGGLHQIEPGGFLKMHVDFNRNARLRLDRRLNLLVYLNKDWEEAYGGHLELWDKDVTQCSKKILPIFNRCVVFTTTDFSFHGHPEPLTCPEGETRKSLALYYYSNGRPASEIRKGSAGHSTLFRARPGETLKIEKKPIGSRVKASIKKLILPMTKS